MKEATGELNLTLIVVIAVGLLIAFFYYVIWPGLDTNLSQNSKCGVANCKNPCGEGSGKNSCNDMIGKLADCTYKDRKGNSISIKCPWKG